jgi:hypothetical protein
MTAHARGVVKVAGLSTFPESSLPDRPDGAPPRHCRLKGYKVPPLTDCRPLLASTTCLGGERDKHSPGSKEDLRGQLTGQQASLLPTRHVLRQSTAKKPGRSASRRDRRAASLAFPLSIDLSMSHPSTLTFALLPQHQKGSGRTPASMPRVKSTPKRVETGGAGKIMRQRPIWMAPMLNGKPQHRGNFLL